jgi:hypothetical protein
VRGRGRRTVRNAYGVRGARLSGHEKCRVQALAVRVRRARSVRSGWSIHTGRTCSVSVDYNEQVRNVRTGRRGWDGGGYLSM